MYLGVLAEGNPASGSVEYLGEGGRVDKEWVLAKPPDDVFPLAILKVNQHAALEAFDQYPEITTAGTIPAEDRLLIAESHQQHPLQIRVNAGLGANKTITSGGLSWLGASVLATVSEMFAPIKEGHPDLVWVISDHFSSKA